MKNTQAVICIALLVVSIGANAYQIYQIQQLTEHNIVVDKKLKELDDDISSCQSSADDAYSECSDIKDALDINDDVNYRTNTTHYAPVTDTAILNQLNDNN